jgi:hypothetical protein
MPAGALRTTTSVAAGRGGRSAAGAVEEGLEADMSAWIAAIPMMRAADAPCCRPGEST